MRQTVLACLLGLACSCSISARAACEGGSCPEEHQAARSAGLLGATSKSCTPKQYPTSGSKVVPFDLTAPLLDVRWGGWDHEKDRYIFALTSPSETSRGGDVWRSEDYGKTWSDITDQLAGAMRDESAFGMTGMEGIVDIQFHPEDTQHMLFHGLGFHHWITQDSGRTFKAVGTPGGTMGFWAELRLHPNQTEWILSRVKRNECLQYEQDLRTNPWCAHDLFVSKDFGETWQNLTQASKGAVASFWDFDWGAHMHVQGNSPYKAETILATAYEDPKHMKGIGVGWDEQIHFIRSDDFFASAHDKLASCGNQFEIAAHKLFVAMPAACPANPDGSKRKVPSEDEVKHVTLFQSNDNGEDFEQVCLPVRDLDLGYSLVSTHDREGIFILVDHDEEDVTAHDAPINNIYASGRANPLYTSTLPRNFKRQSVAGALTDFARVEGLPGVLLANQLEAGVLEQYAQSYRHPQYEEFVQTKISFNGGAQWQDLQAPASYKHASCNRCAPGDQTCRLHLHGPSSWYSGPGGRPSFYSHESAPGLIMAVGNTGAHLDVNADQLCTWLSRDGGLSWEDVRDNAHIYEFGDHGGILVTAKHGTQSPTAEVHISLDEGQCWSSIPLAEAINVDNIRVEPRGASHVFVVHGSACQQSEAYPTCSHTASYSMPAGKMYVLDMRELLGNDFQLCTESDYEPWKMLAPQDGTPDQCLLGRSITQPRRKRDSPCFNGKDWEREDQTVTKCPCSLADLECDFGYERLNGSCVAMPGIKASECPALANKAYKVSSTHLRQVHGDVCTDLSRVIPDTDGNGNYSGGGTAGRAWWRKLLLAVAAVAGVAAVVGGAVLLFARYGGEGLRSRFEDVAAPAFGFVGSCYDWAREKISGRGAWRQAQEAYFEPLPDTELGLEDVDGRSPPLRHL